MALLPEWLDPAEAEVGGLLVLAAAFTVLTVAVAYGIAWAWHRFVDERRQRSA